MEQVGENTSSETDPGDDLSSVASDVSATEPNRSDLNVDSLGKAEMDFHKKKLGRLQRFYSDAYLDLFHQTFDLRKLTTEHHVIEHDLNSDDFSSSQIGCTTWTATEKAKFFDAVSQFGRHDLPRISLATGTKSQIEVKALLDLLQESVVDRQLFERETKNVSHAEIPAAFEIGTELEEKLEKAADALKVVQEGYDFALAQQTHGQEWIVTHDIAKVRDEEAESLVDHGNDGDQNTNPARDVCHFFHMSNWLECSERIFMNWSIDTGYDHWSYIAEEGQRPAITMDALIDFYHLVVSLTQRILQVAIFVAKSRIRASMSSARRPAKIMSQSDVYSALDVLRMKHNSWDYWAKLPRRNKIRVYSDAHRKGKNSREFLTTQAAEDALLHMSMTRLSRSRSRSRGRSVSIGTESAFSHEASTKQDMLDSSRADSSRESHQQSSSDEESESQEADTTDSEATDGCRGPRTVSRKRKRLLLEEAQDEYAQRLDWIGQSRHEIELWQVLGESAPKVLKEEDNGELGSRPRTLRKSSEELNEWTAPYLSERERKVMPEVESEEAVSSTDNHNSRTR